MYRHTRVSALLHMTASPTCTGVVSPDPALRNLGPQLFLIYSRAASVEAAPSPWRQSSGPSSRKNWSSHCTCEGAGPVDATCVRE